MTIAKVLVSGEARAGDVPSERIASYRELVRLHTHLSNESAGYQNEIQALVVVLFPEFTQVFADACLPSALAVLKTYPSAQAIVTAGVEAVYQVLRTQAPAHGWRVRPPRNWWRWPVALPAAAERSAHAQPVCASCVINWNRRKPIWRACKRKSRT
jgi:hypothetical protein